jgi:hypothetical protein
MELRHDLSLLRCLKFLAGVRLGGLVVAFLRFFFGLLPLLLGSESSLSEEELSS